MIRLLIILLLALIAVPGEDVPPPDPTGLWHGGTGDAYSYDVLVRSEGGQLVTR